jgi:hypothetical protein
MKRRTRLPLLLALMVATALLAGKGLTSASRAASSSSPSWLAEINSYREATGLAPVSDDRGYDAGIRAHIRYLELTPKRYITGKYANLHTENPASPYYTAAGALEAGASDLDLGEATNGPGAINVWLTAPFHAIGMLRPGLRRVGLAWDSKGYAGLDVIRGLGAPPPGRPTANGQPVLFPGPNMTTGLTTFGGEVPDPLQTCHWVGRSTGLPLIVLLPKPPPRGLFASLTTGASTASNANRKLCIVDAHTFYTTDTIYGPTGRGILASDNAVLMIPLEVLHDGLYTAQLKLPRETAIKWSFTVRQSGR